MVQVCRFKPRGDPDSGVDGGGQDWASRENKKGEFLRLKNKKTMEIIFCPPGFAAS